MRLSMLIIATMVVTAVACGSAGSGGSPQATPAQASAAPTQVPPRPTGSVDNYGY